MNNFPQLLDFRSGAQPRVLLSPPARVQEAARVRAGKGPQAKGLVWGTPRRGSTSRSPQTHPWRAEAQRRWLLGEVQSLVRGLLRRRFLRQPHSGPDLPEGSKDALDARCQVGLPLFLVATSIVELVSTHAGEETQRGTKQICTGRTTAHPVYLALLANRYLG